MSLFFRQAVRYIVPFICKEDPKSSCYSLQFLKDKERFFDKSTLCDVYPTIENQQTSNKSIYESCKDLLKSNNDNQYLIEEKTDLSDVNALIKTKQDNLDQNPCDTKPILTDRTDKYLKENGKLLRFIIEYNIQPSLEGKQERPDVAANIYKQIRFVKKEPLGYFTGTCSINSISKGNEKVHGSIPNQIPTNSENTSLNRKSGKRDSTSTLSAKPIPTSHDVKYANQENTNACYVKESSNIYPTVKNKPVIQDSDTLKEVTSHLGYFTGNCSINSISKGNDTIHDSIQNQKPINSKNTSLNRKSAKGDLTSKLSAKPIPTSHDGKYVNQENRNACYVQESSNIYPTVRNKPVIQDSDALEKVTSPLGYFTGSENIVNTFKSNQITQNIALKQLQENTPRCYTKTASPKKQSNGFFTTDTFRNPVVTSSKDKNSSVVIKTCSTKQDIEKKQVIQNTNTNLKHNAAIKDLRTKQFQASLKKPTQNIQSSETEPGKRFKANTFSSKPVLTNNGTKYLKKEETDFSPIIESCNTSVTIASKQAYQSRIPVLKQFKKSDKDILSLREKFGETSATSKSTTIDCFKYLKNKETTLRSVIKSRNIQPIVEDKQLVRSGISPKGQTEFLKNKSSPFNNNFTHVADNSTQYKNSKTITNETSTPFHKTSSKGSQNISDAKNKFGHLSGIYSKLKTNKTPTTLSSGLESFNIQPTIQGMQVIRGLATSTCSQIQHPERETPTANYFTGTPNNSDILRDSQTYRCFSSNRFRRDRDNCNKNVSSSEKGSSRIFGNKSSSAFNLKQKFRNFASYQCKKKKRNTCKDSPSMRKRGSFGCLVGPSGTYPSGKGSYKLWRAISLFVCLPTVLLMAYKVLTTFEEPKRPEFKKYSHMRRRIKKFPWCGGSDKSLFHNPHLNALPDGYEDGHNGEDSDD